MLRVKHNNHNTESLTKSFFQLVKHFLINALYFVDVT